MSSSYHSKVRDLLKTRQSCFSFVWDMNFSIIFPYLGEAKVSTANSDLTNFVDVNVCIYYKFTDLTLDHLFHINIIAYCQQNRYVRLAIYTDLFTLTFSRSFRITKKYPPSSLPFLITFPVNLTILTESL